MTIKDYQAAALSLNDFILGSELSRHVSRKTALEWYALSEGERDEQRWVFVKKLTVAQQCIVEYKFKAVDHFSQSITALNKATPTFGFPASRLVINWQFPPHDPVSIDPAKEPQPLGLPKDLIEKIIGYDIKKSSMPMPDQVLLYYPVSGRTNNPLVGRLASDVEHLRSYYEIMFKTGTLESLSYQEITDIINSPEFIRYKASRK